jgi:hypothetical protein
MDGGGVLPYDLQKDKLDPETRKSRNRRKQNTLSSRLLSSMHPYATCPALLGATRLTRGFLAMANLM